jgi:hypothetical protein
MSDTEPTTDFKPNSPLDHFRLTTLSQQDRHDIIALSTSGTAADLLQVETFELSALGANVALDGNWPSPASKSNLVSWSELGQGGRAVRTVVTRRGYLFPLGHRANIIETFQRVIAVDPSNAPSDPANYPVAYLQYQLQIHVTQPVKTYPASGQPFGPPYAEKAGGTTDWPFTLVRMVTLSTPDLDSEFEYFNIPPLSKIAHRAHTTQALWPTVQTADVLWSFVATDLKGQSVSFTMPLVFVYGMDLAGGSGNQYPNSEYSSWTETLMVAYNDASFFNPGHATWSGTGGTALRFADDSLLTGGTTHPTLAIVLGAATTETDANASGAPASPATAAELQAAGQPNFYPTIRSARIRLHAADVLTGSNFEDQAGSEPSASAGGVQFQYYPPYVESGIAGAATAAKGFGPTNPGSVYLAAVNPPDLSLPASTVGGLATPGTTVSGLSAAAGIVGGALQQYADNAEALVADYFQSLSAQLLGGLPLNGIIAGVVDGINRFQLPLVTSQLDQSSGVLTVTYDLVTELGNYSGPLSSPIFVPDAPGGTPGKLRLQGIFQVDPDGGTISSISGSLDPFTVYLLGQGSDTDFLSLHFESLRFAGRTGYSPTIDVNLDAVSFDGPLNFVNTLAQYLERLGGGGLSIAATADTVTASMSIALPNVTVGVFNLSGLKFAGGVVIPLLDGLTTASFSFASQDNPFTLTVAMFGGGGFLNLVVGFGGVQSVQAAFEFSGQLAFNIAVASGSLSLSAGVYYSYADGEVSLSGFVQITGQLSVLGIITISAALQLQLQYASDGNCVTGQASLMVGVSVCGVSQTVTVTMAQTFAGSGAVGAGNMALAEAAPLSDAAGVTWSDLVNSGSWTSYCQAFGVGRSGPS